MLRTVKELQGYTIHARDGEIGSVDEFFFDDEHWTIRYLVANTGGWLWGRKVLISPVSVERTDWDDRHLHVHLTRKQVEESPAVDTEKPVSRQYEKDYTRYYGWPVYWGGAGIWGGWMYPGLLLPPPGTAIAEEGYAAGEAEVPAEEPEHDEHLRSTRQVTGYHIEARDGEIGHVEDFILDDETWQVRYLLVDTRNWWPGKKVLVPARSIRQVSWPDNLLSVEVTRDQIRNAPEYDASAPISREEEARLCEYFGQEKYWETSGERRAA